MRPFATYRAEFRAYRDFVAGIPTELQRVPILITETQPADPDWWEEFEHRMDPHRVR